MTDTSPEWQSDVYAILPDPTGPRVLMQPSDTGWTLPHAAVDGSVLGDSSDRVNQAMRETIGARVITLRYERLEEDEATRCVDGIFVMENLEPAWQMPPGAQWIGHDALVDLPLATPGHRAILDRFIAEDGSTPVLRAPWAQVGWFAEAVAWMEAQLSDQGYTLTKPVAQIKNWCLASLLRADTTRGNVYFKATAGLPLFVNEGAVMQGLSRLFPDNVPAPLCIDRDRRWMLLDDLGPELGWGAPIDVREAVLCLFGRMQIESAGRVEELLAIGCIDRRLDRLADQIDPLLDDGEALSGLSGDEAERLRSLGPRLKEICSELASYRVPDTLVHGDLHLSNAARRDGHTLFFDWTDACVTHPFVDLIDILHEKDASVRARLRDAYLRLWADFEPMDRLLAMWSLAEPLCALHQAVSYRTILANVEPAASRELDGASPFWQRKIIEALQQYDTRRSR